MADTVSPTAIDLHEPKFPQELPYLHGNGSDSTHGTGLPQSRTDLAATHSAAQSKEKVDTPQGTETPSNETSNLQRPTQQISHIQSAIESNHRPQTLQKSATTQHPRLRTRNSFFGKRRTESVSGQRKQLLRQPTLTFDPYSSESSSSSDEDDDA